MDSHARAVAELEREFADWQVWVVHTWNGSRRGTVYCARRWDETGEVLNAVTADQLRRLIADAERRET